MKFVFCLLVLLPIVYCASIEDKRFIFGSFQISTDDLVKQLQSLLGSDATEAACELECHNLVGATAGLVCPLACKTLQTAAQG